MATILPIEEQRCRPYVMQVREHWGQAVESILQVGKVLSEAKDALPHGEFEEMVRNHLPFGVRAAQMLMKIAAHPVLANANHGAHLPASWRTLAELAKVPEKPLAHAVANHWVKPDMERKDVEGLTRRLRQVMPEEVKVQRQPKAPKPAVPTRQLTLNAFLDAEDVQWFKALNPDLADVVLQRLSEAFHQLRQEIE